jgi:hypothetical protein
VRFIRDVVGLCGRNVCRRQRGEVATAGDPAREGIALRARWRGSVVAGELRYDLIACVLVETELLEQLGRLLAELMKKSLVAFAPKFEFNEFAADLKDFLG